MGPTEARPPRIKAIIRKLKLGDEGEDKAWFDSLVNWTVPEHAWDILRMESGWEQVLTFTNRFSAERFPLHEGYLRSYAEWQEEDPEDRYEEQSPYRTLRNGVPFQLMGFSWEELEDMWTFVRNGLAALALLPAVPRNHPGFAEELQAIRQEWLESAARVIPEETLRRIPEGGIPLERLEEAVRGTSMEAVHLTGQWVWATTGSIFLDESFPEDFEYNYSDDWDMETIEYASREWEKARRIVDPASQLAGWLEEDLPERFKQMLELVLERLDGVPEDHRGKR